MSLALADLHLVVPGQGIRFSVDDEGRTVVHAVPERWMPGGVVWARNVGDRPVLEMSPYTTYSGTSDPTGIPARPDCQLYGHDFGVQQGRGGAGLSLGDGATAPSPDTSLARTAPGELSLDLVPLSRARRLVSMASGLPVVTGTAAKVVAASATIAAGAVREGDTITLVAAGTVLNTTGASASLQVHHRLRGQLALATVTITVPSHGTPRHWRAVIETVVGPGGSAQSSATEAQLTEPTTATSAASDNGRVGSTTTSFAMGAAHILDVELQHSTSSPAMTTTTQLVRVTRAG